MDASVFRRRPVRERLTGAAGALLLQGGFLFLFLYSMPRFSRPIEAGRELIFVLHRPPPPAPSPLPGTPPQVGPAPVRPAPSLPQAPALNIPSAPALPDISGFGQALNDCAPEKYSSLRPEQKARCPKPGAGVAIQELPKLLGPLPQAKDEALWQEDWDEAHWRAALCDPAQGSVALCQIRQQIAEFERAEDVRYHLAKDKAASLQEPKRPLPQNQAGAGKN
jgi:hypothetical protein